MAFHRHVLAVGVLFANLACSAPVAIEQSPFTLQRRGAEQHPLTKRSPQIPTEAPLGFPFGGPRTTGFTIYPGPYGPPPFVTSFIPEPSPTTLIPPVPTTSVPPTETSQSPTTPPTTLSTQPSTPLSLPPTSTVPISNSTTTASTVPSSPVPSSPAPSSPAPSSPAASSPAASSPAASSPAPAPSSGKLQISLDNTLDSDNVHVYVTGLDSTGRLIMLTTSGEYYYPDASGSTPQAISADIAIPIGKGSTSLTLPDFIWSGRIWFADGTLSFSAVLTTQGTGLVVPSSSNPNDPDINVNWGFMELTYDTTLGLFANLSFVDFVGVPLGLRLLQSSGATQTALGLPADAASQLCQKLTEQESQDSQPWSQLCSSKGGSLLRVVSPSTLLSQEESAFANYWNEYIDQTWQKYVTEPLTINTQTSVGNIQCTSDGTTITCPNDNKSYSKPSAADVFGCASGPFAIELGDSDVHKAVVPRLCAAIHRSTLDHRHGNVQPSVPPSKYYHGRVTNWYSALVHQIELDHKGYAFPYDDVSPSTQDDTAGVVAATDPQLLTITIGGPAQ